MVPAQLKNFTPVGDRDEHGHEGEEGQQDGAGGEQVVGPHGHRQAGDRDRRGDQGLVAEQGLAAEDRQDLGGDAEERQREDVDLGVAEEPEQVLPEDRAAAGCVEDVRAEAPVDFEDQQGRRDHWEGEQGKDRGEQRVPGEDRHPEHGHARRAHAEDGGDEVDGAEDGAEARQGQPHDPQVPAGPRRVGRAGKRRVGVPPPGRAAARGQQAEQQDQAAEEEQVVAEQVQPGKCHVGRADLQRHHHVREADEKRGGEQQQHQGAVHGEQLVVDLVGHEVLVRAQQLDPDQESHHTADQEEPERRDQVQVPDDLVVSGRQPAREERPFTAGAGRRVCRPGHGCIADGGQRSPRVLKADLSWHCP
jgi:hypothetical protein